MNLNEQSLGDICEMLASVSPVPGGGSASAIAGGLAAALIQMGCRLALKRADDDKREEFEHMINRVGDIQTRMLQLADLDARAYASVVSAYKLPKSTEEEKVARGRAIHRAARQAGEVPLETATLAREVIDAADVLIDRGNPNALSDAQVARALAEVALSGGIKNVEANLPDMNDEDRCSLTKRLDPLR